MLGGKIKPDKGVRKDDQGRSIFLAICAVTRGRSELLLSHDKKYEFYINRNLKQMVGRQTPWF